MELLTIIGYLLAIVVGLSLGILGGGGSTLTVPILVYVLKMDPKTAIALSLAIVGTTSLVGTYSHQKQGNIALKTSLLFIVFAVPGTFVGSQIAQYLSGTFQMILFACVMFTASIFMFKGRKSLIDKDKEHKPHKILVAISGFFVGNLTGLVGVGGGFMIVPALVLLLHVPMKKAIGSSLFIIALNSFTGFLGYLSQIEIPWLFLIIYTSLTIVGILFGSYLVKFIPQQKLKKAFAIFLLIMSLFILYKNKDKLTGSMSFFLTTPSVQIVSLEKTISQSNFLRSFYGN